MIRLYTDGNYNFNTESSDAPIVFHGVYFHGEAEEILGHDIICVPREFEVNEGVHDFEVIDNTHGHQIVTGRLFVWNTLPFGLKGLAVADGAVSDYEYAKLKFNQRASFL